MKLIVVTQIPPSPPQILQNQLEILQKTRSDRSVDEGTSSSDSRGKSVISSSESGRAYTEEIQDGKA